MGAELQKACRTITPTKKEAEGKKKSEKFVILAGLVTTLVPTALCRTGLLVLSFVFLRQGSGYYREEGQEPHIEWSQNEKVL